MRKLSVARRRVVVMAAGVGSMGSSAPLMGPGIARWLGVPVHYVALPLVGLEAVGLVYVMYAFLQMKRNEDRCGL